MSHSRTTAAVAVADCPVGIDIEANRQVQFQKVADRFLSSDEQSAAANIELGLLMAWTAKEAVFKADQGRHAQFLTDIDLDIADFRHGSSGEAKFDIEFFAVEPDTILAVATPSGLHNKIKFVTLYERGQAPNA